MTADVPDTVACPCGNGYAERRPTAIHERVNMGRMQVTHCYRHTGCPIGGHIVTVSDYIERRAGPLFTAGPHEVQRMTGVAPPELVADGGNRP